MELRRLEMDFSALWISKSLLACITLLNFNLLCTPLKAAETDDIKSIMALFPFNQSKAQSIKTKGCKLNEAKWAALIITHEAFQESIKYGPECDIQGSFTVKYNEYFPLSLKIQKNELKSFVGKMHINIEFKESPYLILQLDDSKLSSDKKSLEFKLKQEFQIDPFSEEPIKKNLGTVISIKKDGKYITKKMAP